LLAAVMLQVCCRLTYQPRVVWQVLGRHSVHVV
jgi:hypothetical protein